MNLAKLFERQKGLMEHIEKEHPQQPGENRFEKKILSLLVELGECANEWRGFKYWSKNQNPRIKLEHVCPTCEGTGDESFPVSRQYLEEGQEGLPFEPCLECDATGELGETNPLLEEYVDGLHFVLELGIEQGINKVEYKGLKTEKITTQFIQIYFLVSEYQEFQSEYNLMILIQYYLGLGKMLGFTWEEIEQAYMEKNAVNHKRQESGY